MKAPRRQPGWLHRLTFRLRWGLKQSAACAGRVEFTEHFPENTQGVFIQPVGDEGVLVAATDTQRGFGRLDQVKSCGNSLRASCTFDCSSKSGWNLLACTTAQILVMSSWHR